MRITEEGIDSTGNGLSWPPWIHLSTSHPDAFSFHLWPFLDLEHSYPLSSEALGELRCLVPEEQID